MGKGKGKGGAPKVRRSILWGTYNLSTGQTMEIVLEVSGPRAEPYEWVQDVTPEASKASASLGPPDGGPGDSAGPPGLQEPQGKKQLDFFEVESEAAKATYPTKTSETVTPGLKVNKG